MQDRGFPWWEKLLAVALCAAIVLYLWLFGGVAGRG